MALQRTVLMLTLLLTLANAIPTINLPLNSQVPPVARVSQPFSYTFSSSTFSSVLPIIYTLSSGPSWLSLDGATHTLSGTPSTNDIGTGIVTGVPISITAADSSGSITHNATLVVSENPAPVLRIDPSTQMSALGVFSAPSTLLYHPSTPFNIKFDPNTFSANGGSLPLKFYAVTPDNTPLPSWIIFDNSSLSFSGQTPDYKSLIQPPQTFGMKLIASDVEGFSGTFITFNIEVGVHLLSFRSASMSLNVTAGDHIDFTGLGGNLQIGGQTANTSAISSIVIDKPSWLNFDNSTLQLTGTAPAGVTPSIITLVATDRYGDTANATIAVAVAGSIFTKPIPELPATIGSSFSYNLSGYLANPSDVETSITSVPTEPWLSLNSTSFVLSGQVPTNTDLTSIKITLKAASKSTHGSESQPFELSLISAISPSSPSKNPSSHTARITGASQTAVPTPPLGNTRGRFSRGIIAAIVLPIALVMAALILALLCYQKRRYDAKTGSRPPSKNEISGPVLEAASSVPDLVLPLSIDLPKSLELDTSGFTHGITTNEKHVDTWNPPRRKSNRRSYTTTDISGPRTSQYSDTEDHRKRTRSYSDNTLSQTDTSWVSTQECAYPPISRSRTNSSHRLARTYSNYSRKGHQRRSARVLSGSIVEAALNEGNPPATSQRPDSSILNLKDVNFTLTPLDRFSVLHGSIDNPEGPSGKKSTARQSRGSIAAAHQRRRSGIGHGGRRSISSLSSRSVRLSSIGHGQHWGGDLRRHHHSLSRNSRTWLTVATSNPSETKRGSNFSVLSEYSDTYPAYNNNVHMSIRRVTKSPDILSTISPSEGSAYSRNSRPVSRRVGSSPFFSGSLNRESRVLSPKRGRTSYADSFTVPEEGMTIGNLESTILHGLREVSDEAARDHFGISYGLAKEGTRHLRSYIESQMKRNKTRSSVLSNDSKDSRFESAPSHRQSPVLPEEARNEGRNRYEESVEAEYSDDSWETQQSVRDGEGNLMGCDTDGVIRTATRVERPRSHSFAGDGSGSDRPALDVGHGARIGRGAGRRPISIDVGGGIRSVRGTLEQGDLDYTAYI